MTSISLILAQLPAVQALQGAQQLGNLGLHCFFAVIGIRSLLGEMLRVGPEVFYYTPIVVGVHGAFLVAAVRALKGPVPIARGGLPGSGRTVHRDGPGRL